MNDEEKTREQLCAELQAARQQIAEFTSILELVPDVILKTDAQGFVKFASKAVPGVPHEDVIGMNVVDFTQPEMREQSIRMQKRVQAGESAFAEFEAKGPDGQPTWVAARAFPIMQDDRVVGQIGILSDITPQKRVEVERAQLQEQVIKAQRRALQELSTPIIPVMDRIIVMPLIGSIDSLRAKDITRALLAGISQYRAKIVIVDITGVPLVDSGVADHLNKTIMAARLKGAQTIVTGMSDAVAEAIVELGIDWSGIQTLSDLQTGLITALNTLGYKLGRQ